MTNDPALQSVLSTARKELLDLSTRNRLLSTARGKSTSSRLEIFDERSEQVFQQLVTDGKTFSFQARADKPHSDPGTTLLSYLEQPEEDEKGGNGIAARHTDDKLQTGLTSEQLQKNLLKMFYDARTYEEEQGVGILYLAVGFLKWFEDPKSDRERFAPLLLIPVKLDRASATAKFKIKYTGDDISTNLSLQARLQNDFGIKLPDVPDTEELNPGEYFQQVARAVQNQPRWEVLQNDIVLSFFSFAKFLMYRDLATENWPSDRSLEANKLIRSILREGFAENPPICGEDEKIDAVLDTRDLIHVIDADSSQALVIEEAKRGRNLVIQGPPGTGKSQTIANIIAAAVKAGKTVLFVAEKSAALDVVERRLASVGLEDMCLELHSHKANKKTLLQELERTLQLGKPAVEDVERHCYELTRCRDRINRHLELIHSPVKPSELTPFQIVGQLVRLRANGTRPPTFKLVDPLKWIRSDFESRIGLLKELAERVAEIGIPAQHAWAGVQLDVVLPTDVDRITVQCAELTASLERLVDAAGAIARTLGVPEPTSANDISVVAKLAQKILAAPPMDRGSLANEVWDRQRPQIDELVRDGQLLTEARQSLAGVVAETAWDVDLTATRTQLAAHGRSWFRIFRRGFREAQATLRGLLVSEPPQALNDRLAIVDQLIAAQQAKRNVGATNENSLGTAAFGSYWNGEHSDWRALAKICQWESECRDAKLDANFRQVIARLPNGTELSQPLAVIRSELKSTVEGLKSLFQSLKLDLPTAFGVKDLLALSIESILAKLRTWHWAPEGLSQWIGYSVRRKKLESLGLGELLAELHSRATTYPEVSDRCEMAFYEATIREIFRREPDLAGFSGKTHEQLLENFRRLDQERIVIARHEVALAHFLRIPKSGAEVGEIGVVRREIQKKRRHLPIRKLIAEAGRAIQAIKPVFMMSPISVAQYLEPGNVEFDLLLIDEASQVPPVDALGAVARARQIVVVGDSKQLPPTRFFSRMLGDDVDETADQESSAGDMESILGLCCASNVPQRLLAWHYRSKHHSLIAVSNREFYDNRLYVIPSPSRPAAGQGLTLEFVSDGIFDRGGTATNRVEARRVAEAVMAHARQSPELSLMVGTFSVAQKDAIWDELERLRRADPSLEHFFVSSKEENFDVKNLETIQGDERDVVFISVGYGKDSSGYTGMGFGPLSNDGGERRLNVLITRARICCRVFSSIRADDIDLQRAKSRGAQALKTFLKYAESGLLDTGTATGKDHDSEFERQVAKALAAQGYQTDPQVGVAGFFIDLAVIDSEKPGRYLLGIECDGANYHRSRSARDRDRLREAVLRDRGWRIHRIWSTDWFQRPDEQLRKLVAAIEEAKLGPSDSPELARPTESPQRESSRYENDSDGSGIIREHTSADETVPVGSCRSEPYQLASFRVSVDREIHELPPGELARVVAKIIDIEGPIHREEIARRVTQLWGLQRAGKRIKESVDRAIDSISLNAVRKLDGEFLAATSKTEFVVRDRGQLDSNTLKKPEMLPPVEIRHALAAIVQVNFGVTADQAIVEAARLFGIRSTSAQLKQIFEIELKAMIAQQSLELRNCRLYAIPKTTVASEKVPTS